MLYFILCVHFVVFLWCSLHSEDNLLQSVTAPLCPGIFYSGRKEKKEIIKMQKLSIVKNTCGFTATPPI